MKYIRLRSFSGDWFDVPEQNYEIESQIYREAIERMDEKLCCG